MKRQTYINLNLILAIALVIASKRLQKHTGIAADDWKQELLAQSIYKFNHWTVERIQKYIARHYQ